MEALIKVKTFIKGIWEIRQDPQRTSVYLFDKRLSQAEKKIIEGFALLRKKNYQRIFELISPLEPPHPIVQAYKHAILGIANNNSGRLDQGSFHLEKAHSLSRNYDFRDFNYFILFQLFILNLNLKNESEMKRILDSILVLKIESEEEFLYTKRCQLGYLSFTLQLKEAQVVFDEIQKVIGNASEYHQTSFLIDKFDFAIKCRRLDQANEVLNEMKSFRTFTPSVTYQYMKVLLNFLLCDGPLYFYDEDLSSMHDLSIQIKVLQALKDDNRVIAKQEWDKLVAESPKIYADGFKYLADPCLFSLCLEKVMSSQRITSLTVSDLTKSKEDIFLEIIEQAQGPIKKDDLYFILWGKKPETKEDYLKLSSLVYRARSKCEYEIKSKKGVYLKVV